MRNPVLAVKLDKERLSGLTVKVSLLLESSCSISPGISKLMFIGCSSSSRGFPVAPDALSPFLLDDVAVAGRGRKLESGGDWFQLLLSRPAQS
jgi:hypothetical protein